MTCYDCAKAEGHEPECPTYGLAAKLEAKSWGLKFGQMGIVADPSVPEGEIHAVNAKGEVTAKVIRVGHSDEVREKFGPL